MTDEGGGRGTLLDGSGSGLSPGGPQEFVKGKVGGD